MKLIYSKTNVKINKTKNNKNQDLGLVRLTSKKLLSHKDEVVLIQIWKVGKYE